MRVYSNINLKPAIRPDANNLERDSNTPEEISIQIFLSPKLQTPFTPSHGNLSPEVFVGSFTISIASEKDQRVVQIGQIDLYWDEMDPGLNSV